MTRCFPDLCGRYKEAWANPTSWHVDVPYWSFNSLSAVSFWLALDDADLGNGCLHFMPGSHKELQKLPDPYTEVKIGKNMRDVFEMYGNVCGRCRHVDGRVHSTTPRLCAPQLPATSCVGVSQLPCQSRLLLLP